MNLEQCLNHLKQKSKKFNLIDESFPKQAEAILDKSKLKAYNCTRRSGKTNTVAREMIDAFVNHPRSNQLYIALTLDSAKEIIWSVLTELLDDHGIEYRTIENKGIIIGSNGSRIRLFGADSGYKEMRKVLGQKLFRVCIDEAGSFTIDMNRLVYQMIMPALTDLDGQLILLGTCENIPRTFFERVTEGIEQGWSVHKWTTFDNPYLRVNWEKEIKRIMDANPLAHELSWFKTHYLNQWCTDDNLMIIKLTDHTIIDQFNLDGWTYVLGVDLGYNDATALSVLAYHQNIDFSVVVESFKSSEMDITQVAGLIRNMHQKYPITSTIIDGANKQAVVEMRTRHMLPLIAAQKTDKNDYLRILRDDILQLRLKIFKNSNNELINEWSQLQWKDEHKDKEDPRCQNHLSDATLYAWRFVYHYLSTPKEIPLDKNTNEYMQQFERDLSDQMIKQQEEYL